MIKEEGEKRNFLSDYFSVKPVCPCPTAGGPARRQAGTGRESRCGMQAGGFSSKVIMDFWHIKCFE